MTLTLLDQYDGDEESTTVSEEGEVNSKNPPISLSARIVRLHLTI